MIDSRDPRRSPRRARRVSTAILSLVLGLALVACSGPAGFVDAESIQREIEAARAETPLPPGATFAAIDLDSNGAYGTGSGTNMIQFQAACAWFDYWANAIASGDASGEAQGSEMADEIRTWRTYVTSDVSLRSYWDAIIDQARLGDPGGLVQMTKANCP